MTGDLSPYQFADEESLGRLMRDIHRVREQEMNDLIVETAPSFKGFGRYALRGLTNKRTTVPGKALATLIAPLSYGKAHFGRSPSYHPLTDTIVSPWNNLGVAAHEVGHAIDFNDGYVPSEEGLLSNLMSKAKRDAYLLAYPYLPIAHEIRAWEAAKKALKDSYKHEDSELSTKEKKKLNKQFARAKDPALSTYAVGTLARYRPGAGILGLPALLGTAVSNPFKKKYQKELDDAIPQESEKKQKDKEKLKEDKD